MSFYTTLLQEALEIFHKQGVEQVTRQTLIRKLNVSETTFNKYFTSQADLLHQAVSLLLEEEKARQRQVRNAALNAVEELVGLLNHGVSSLRAISPAYFPELIRLHPEVWALYRQHSQQHTLPQVTAILEWGVAEGLFLTDLDCRLASRLLLGQINVLFDQTVFPASTFPLSTVYKSAYLCLIRGMCTRKGLKMMEKLMPAPEAKTKAATGSATQESAVELPAEE